MAPGRQRHDFVGMIYKYIVVIGVFSVSIILFWLI